MIKKYNEITTEELEKLWDNTVNMYEKIPYMCTWWEEEDYKIFVESVKNINNILRKE